MTIKEAIHKRFLEACTEYANIHYGAPGDYEACLEYRKWRDREDDKNLHPNTSLCILAELLNEEGDN